MHYAYSHKVFGTDHDDSAGRIPETKIGENVTEIARPLGDILKERGMTQRQLMIAANISSNSVSRAVNGGSHMTSYDVAYRIADALGLRVNQIRWPNGLSEAGRPAGTGTGTITAIRKPAKRNECEIHNLERSASGSCMEC